MKLNKRTALSFFMIAMFLGTTLISLSDMLFGGNKNMDTIVVLVTSMGNIEIALATEEAPITTANFMGYVEDDFYNDTVFHRVMQGFMIQGGGFIATGKQKITGDPIVLESYNGLTNRRGTIAMARTSIPDSATSQFFINLVDNAFLDKTSTSDGYAVFGEVVEGMDVVDAIGGVKTATIGLFDDWPEEDVVILGAYVKEK
ncbi:MAG: peptidylprolyl isomerase [Candidatus Bathyarchaeota archaeon]|nr:peptidylprolyl isomerase [Candidatus Bathyarchaeota archaeon]